ncbi:MAG: tRNA (5-methylaminomethyl-2-thiouridine)(34)-methyltransferase MnmD [Bacteroidetes bacterium]|nr:tRNA (5-methylaminomethyl-2-thiouridine)(34)-methyltransferase MnmD [Bacteroidota bacterium]
MKIESLTSADGSSTLYIPEMDETYHSRKGAVTESEYVYIKMGLANLHLKQVRLLEFGLGTGLNALLSLRYANQNRIQLDYTSVEKYPLEQGILQTINYAEHLSMKDEWQELHQIIWQESSEWDTFHRLLKWQGDFLEAPLEEGAYDLIYYDAFAPSKQADVWGMEYLNKAYRALKTGGILATYCAQGQFKRNLKSLGFEVENLPGPPGKMEMVRARKTT